ncbi:MAG: MFS transporter [Gammaproteobacteria bacterium]
MSIATPEKASIKAWIISMVGGLFFTFYFMQMAFLNPIADAMSDAFKLSPDQLGTLTSVYLLAVAIMSLPAGILTDKCRARPLMLTVLALSIVSLVIMRFVESYPALVVLRFLQGLLHGFCLLAALKLASQWIPSRQMATASSFIITIGLLGGAATQPLFLWLFNTFGLANTFLANAGMGAALWILFFIIVHDNPAAHSHADTTWKQFAQGLKQSLSNIQNSAAGLYVCFLNLPLIIFGTSWGAIYLENTFGMRGEQGTLVLSMVFFGIMAGSPVAGFISDAFRTRKQLLTWGAFATFLMFATLFFLKQPSVTVLAAVFFAIGFISSCQVVAYPMIAESNNPAFTGTALSVLTTVLMLGNTAGQALFSQAVATHTVVDATTQLPLYTAGSFTYAVWGMAGVLIIGGVMAFWFKESFGGTQ